MSIIELLLIGIGLSMDAFAVSVCKGLSMQKYEWKKATLLAVFFGGFQALMPLIGWFLGSQFQRYIVSVDHWIAFGLLTLIGGQMLYEAVRGEEDSDEADDLQILQVLMLAVATSIDALAVGITFALLPGTNIIASISLIGCTTFLLTYVGVFVGNRFGSKYESKAQIAGGIILILIGLKILLEHLGILNF
ncbi:MAG: manganese efflux pump [Lachnospiraceae bacterium]|nr:manganese efflux pump [Lachnospiraceae bacterium]